MRALFITTETNNCDPVVESWAAAGHSAVRFKYWCEGHRMDGDMVLVAERLASGAHMPEGWDGPAQVAFYIGACRAVGNPGIDTLGMIGRALPLIHVCFDGGDSPWWPVMQDYRQAGVFRAQVNIDGADCPGADLVTLCPVDARFYEGEPVERDIAFGFSGNCGSMLRQQMVSQLMQSAGLQLRQRSGLENADYKDYAGFLRRCKMVLNIPVSGSGQYMHVKARIIEAGLAGAAVLEHRQSPAHRWFPGALIPYGDVGDIERLVAEGDVEDTAPRLARMVRDEFAAGKIWDAMLDVAGVRR